MADIRLGIALLLASAVTADDPQQQQLTPMNERGARTPEKTVVPAYPARARRERIEGDVEVCFNVDRHGKPTRIAVRRSSHRLFEKPARDAVRASRYKPLQEGQEPTGIKTCRTFRFRLDPIVEEVAAPPA